MTDSPDHEPPSGVGRLTGVLAVTGRMLVITGLLMLSFAGFQLWGTGLAEARAQDDLARSLRRQLDATETRNDGESGEPAGEDRGPDAVLEPVVGGAMGRIVMPTIGVDKTIVEGVSRDDLRLGPGHYPTTALPGRRGNSAIAGHRTTNGAPFFDLDGLAPGDPIRITTVEGTFEYVVEAHEAADGSTVGHFIVDPTESWVLADTGDDRLTLTACHPRYSAEKRIVVTAVLTGPASVPDLTDDRKPAEIEPANAVDPDPTDPDPTGSGQAVGDTGDGLGWNLDQLPATLTWAALTAAVGWAGWWLGRRRPKPARLAVYGAATVLFVPCLFFCFTHLDQLIPAV